MSRANKEAREGLKLRAKSYDPMESMPDLDEVKKEAKRRVRVTKEEKSQK